MSSSGGFEETNDNHIESPGNIQEGSHQPDKADAAKRERKIEKVTRGEKQTPGQQATARRNDTPEPSSPVKRSGRKPGDVSPELGQDSGTAWQESQQMGRTGRGGVQNPQTNP